MKKLIGLFACAGLLFVPTIIFGAGQPGQPYGKTSSGTAFFVSKSGYLVSSYHVVENCENIKIKNLKIDLKAQVLYTDKNNDLAILQAEISNNDYATLREGAGIRTGDDIIIIESPPGPIHGDTIKVTRGNINSLTGPGNDTDIMQITAPVQPGSSGGPLIDLSGNVVGMTSAKLNEIAVAKAAASLSPNVYFAVKSQTLQIFLDKHEIDYVSKSSDIEIKASKLVKNAEDYTVQVRCSN